MWCSEQPVTRHQDKLQADSKVEDPGRAPVRKLKATASSFSSHLLPAPVMKSTSVSAVFFSACRLELLYKE